MIVKPKALKPGDTIGMIAAASNIKKDLLEQGCRELERLGFKTYCRPDITSSFRYFSGPHDRRTGEFLEMLKSPDIAAIFCARGGYGSGHLIPKIDRDTVCANAKIVNGSSDITILLNWIERCGVVSFHGPMVATAIREGEYGYDRTTLLDMLQGKQSVTFPDARDGDPAAGDCGRPPHRRLPFPRRRNPRDPARNRHADAIFVLEDLDTKPYQIDRMITHLKHAGKFDGVHGVVFGEMLNCAQHPEAGLYAAGSRAGPAGRIQISDPVRVLDWTHFSAQCYRPLRCARAFGPHLVSAHL